MRGVDQDGSPIAGLCDAATIGATVPLTVSVPKPLAPLCVLTAIECGAALATEGLKATPETITLLGATPEALAACELLTSLGADVTVVSPRKNGDDDAYAAGAAMAFHPAALDDEDEEDYGLVLDYVGDEGNGRATSLARYSTRGTRRTGASARSGRLLSVSSPSWRGSKRL